MERTKILERLNISALSEMQRAVIDAFSKHHDDLVILSSTGSGKTLAYLLPLVESLSSEGSQLQSIVVVPSRELALQSVNVMKAMRCRLRGMACYGGRPAMDEHREMRQFQPHVIFGTPGRLNDHIDKQNIDVSTVHTLVIDEFDKCLEMGFQAEMQQLVGSLPAVRRRVLLSATDAEAIPRFVDMAHAIRIDYRSHESTDKRIDFYTVASPSKDKLPTLARLLLMFGQQQTIVFLNHRESVERTARHLSDLGFVVSMLHGGLEQRQREDALYRFANGSATVLVSTDLASRGIDLPDTDNIVHYHLPETESNYVHRIGRTARWDKRGRVFFLLNGEESLPSYVANANGNDKTIKNYELIINKFSLSPPVPLMETLYIGKGKRDKLSKGDILGFLCKTGGLSGADIGRIDVRERYTYVAVSRAKVGQLLKQVQGKKIKGIKTVIEKLKS